MPDNMKRKTPLAAHLMRAVSVEAPADPRTVRKVLLGESVSPLARDRILRALKARGLTHLVQAGRVESTKGGGATGPEESAP